MTNNDNNPLNLSYETTGGHTRNTKVCPETVDVTAGPQGQFPRYSFTGPTGRMFEVSRTFNAYYDKWIISSYSRGNWRLMGELDGRPAFITAAIAAANNA